MTNRQKKLKKIANRHKEKNVYLTEIDRDRKDSRIPVCGIEILSA